MTCHGVLDGAETQRGIGKADADAQGEAQRQWLPFAVAVEERAASCNACAIINWIWTSIDFSYLDVDAYGYYVFEYGLNLSWANLI